MGRLHYISRSALHEAGHVIVARHFGRTDVIVKQHARRGRPGVEIALAGLDANQIALILLAGMAAEQIMAQEAGEERPLRDLCRVGRGDLAFLRWLGIRIQDLEQALDVTAGFLRDRWQDVLRTAVCIQQAWDAGRDWTPAGNAPGE